MSGAYGSSQWLYRQPFSINQSLRFEDGDNPYLSKTMSGTGGTIFTFSCWVKLGNLSINRCLLQGYADGSNFAQIVLYSGDYVGMYSATSGTARLFAYTKAVQRDPTAWYHILIKFNGTSGSEEFKIFINGENQTLTTSTALSAHQSNIGKNNAHYLGNNFNQSLDMDGYLADVHFIDGQALEPSSFIETRDNLLQPKLYVGTFGTNGFKLTFEDSSSLGDDTSGKGNDFTPSGLLSSDKVLDNPTNNWCTLNPLFTNGGATQTFAEGNLKFTADSNYALANGTFAMRSGKWYWETLIQANYISNVGITRGTNTAGNSYVGYDPNGNVFGFGYQSTGATAQTLIYGASGDGTASGATLASSQTSYTTGDIIGCSFDADAGELKFYKNNSLIYTVSSINTHDWMPANSAYGTSNVNVVNFGQDSSFANNKTSGSTTASDANGVGDFFYTPPTGFLALAAENLPSPAIEDPTAQFNTVLYAGDGNATQSVDIETLNPDFVWVKSRSSSTGHFSLGNTVVGDFFMNSNQDVDEYSFSAFNFNTDNTIDVPVSANDYSMNTSSNTYVAWNWVGGGDSPSQTYVVKVVSDSGNKYRFDDFGTSALTLNLQEGGTYTFDQSDSSMSSHPMKLSTTANGSHGGGSTYSTGVTYELDGSSVTESAFVSGFSSATSRKLIIVVAASAPTLYYFCHYHSGMGGQINTNTTHGSTNLKGTLQSTVSANTSTGFSVGIFQSNGASSVVTTGHGLSSAPEMVIWKNRSAASYWFVYHKDLASTQYYLRLEEPNAQYNATTAFFSSDSTKIGIRQSSLALNTNDCLFYAFHSVEGFSLVSSFTGNGLANGSFVFTGFRPAWILIKNINDAEFWTLIDNKREGYNETNSILSPNSPTNEYSAGGGGFDIVSNGFKVRGTSNNFNGSGKTNIFIAFAESPFKTASAR